MYEISLTPAITIGSLEVCERPSLAGSNLWQNKLLKQKLRVVDANELFSKC